LHALLQGSGGLAEDAVAIHYGSNNGCIPDAFCMAEELDGVHQVEREVTSNSQRGDVICTSVVDALGLFPSGAHFVVFGKDAFYQVFGTKARAEMRLKELGAKVQSRCSASTTHILVANGVDRASVPHRLLHFSEGNHAVAIVDEGWLLRHVRSASIQSPPHAQESRQLPSRGERAPAVCSPLVP
jgi:hypothetical protein